MLPLTHTAIAAPGAEVYVQTVMFILLLLGWLTRPSKETWWFEFDFILIFALFTYHVIIVV